MKTTTFLLLFVFYFTLLPAAHAARIFSEEYETPPVVVPANGMAKIPSQIFTVPVDGWVIQAHWDVLNGPSYLLHHAWAITLEGKNYLCGGPGSAIFATGREHQRLLTPSGYPLSEGVYGKKVRKGLKFEIGRVVMLHNIDPFPYKDVKVRLTVLYYVPEEGDKQPTELDVLMMNIGPEPHTNVNFWCRNLLGGNTSEYLIPPKTTKTDKWKEELVVKRPIKVGLIGVHAHDYVQYVRLLVNGKEAWRAPLVKDDRDHLVEIPFAYNPGLTIKNGDKLNIEAQYKNPTDKPVDAMAFIFVIYEKDGDELPVEIPPVPKEPLPKDESMPEDHHHHH